MNTPNETKAQNDLARVLAKINEIAEKSADGDYIYRGESNKYHKKVSSGLYREYEADIEAEDFDIAVVQEEILREAKEYTTHKMDDPEILAQLQHHGGKTNLIDFTTDYLVALFFACDGNRDKPGKVIFLQNQSGDYEVLKPPRTIPRAGVQKSIFVQSPSGVVEPDAVVDIPADLKGPMLDYLRKHHDISTKTIYNDLLGFIENRRIHKSVYTEFFKGFTCQKRGDSAKDLARKEAWYEKASMHYTEAIDLNPELAIAYNNRGTAYVGIGEVDTAIQDYDTAIALRPDFADAYVARGLAYAVKGDFESAIKDFSTAIALRPDFADAYVDRGLAYGVKGDFESEIKDYNTAIEKKPDYAEAYAHRGLAYGVKGDFESEIKDYNTAIEKKPDYAEAYAFRGVTWLRLSEWEKAKSDLIIAKAIGFDIVAHFHNAEGSVAAFESNFGVQIPEDIAALLRGE